MNNPPELKLVTPTKDEPEANPAAPETLFAQQVDDNTIRLADAPIAPSADSQIRSSSPPKLRVLSAAEKADREVNEILIRRLMRALLADDRKAA